MKGDLPQGWMTEQLSSLINDCQPGFASGQKNVEEGVAHLRMNNIGLNGNLVLGLIRRVPATLAKNKYNLQVGDVLICTTNSGKLVGKCAYFYLQGRYVFSNHLTRIRPNSAIIDGRFLSWNLWLHWKLGGFDDKCKNWVNQSTIPKIALLETEISLPPISEQRRIVAKLEKLLAKVDACQKRLEKIPVILKRFRQSVLAAACSGKLTEDWRGENKSLSNSADTLEKVCRARHCSELNLILPNDEAPKGEIPTAWTWVRFGVLIGELKNGLSPKPNKDPVGIPILRISSVRPGRVALDDIRFLPVSGDVIQTCLLKDGDLLFTRYNGSLELLGICGMVRGLGKRKFLYPDKLMRIRFDHMAVIPEYVEIFFRINTVHERIISRSKSSAGQNGISGIDIKAQAFALPSLAEQQEIVRRVEALLKCADQIEARYQKAKAHVDKLTQSILAKAFRGELVPQDPNDEPASVLLERIGGEREKARPSRRRQQ